MINMNVIDRMISMNAIDIMMNMNVIDRMINMNVIGGMININVIDGRSFFQSQTYSKPSPRTVSVCDQCDQCVIYCRKSCHTYPTQTLKYRSKLSEHPLLSAFPAKSDCPSESWTFLVAVFGRAESNEAVTCLHPRHRQKSEQSCNETTETKPTWLGYRLCISGLEVQKF